MVDIIDLEPKYKARLLWDLLEHDEVRGWMSKLGLVPPSEEGLEMDHVACHKRAALVQPLSPLISAFAAMASEIQTAYIIDAAGDMLAEDEREDAEEMYSDVVFRHMQSASLAIIAELLQEGVLAYGPEVKRV
jgi:hypothetical protein